MKLNLELADLQIGPQGGLASFVLTTRIQPDSEAISAIAEPAVYKRPNPAYCNLVVPQPVPGYVSGQYIKDRNLGPPYPQVVGVKRTFAWPHGEEPCSGQKMPAGGASPNVCVPIADGSEKPVYQVLCSANVSGISCVLLSSSGEIDLLGNAVDLYSRRRRADFELQQLFLKCGKYPEWGSTRSFRLRGMALTLEVSDVRFAGEIGNKDYFMGGLDRFGLTVDVAPSSGATDALAKPIPIVDWSFRGWRGYPLPDTPALAEKECSKS